MSPTLVLVCLASAGSLEGARDAAEVRAVVQAVAGELGLCPSSDWISTSSPGAASADPAFFHGDLSEKKMLPPERDPRADLRYDPSLPYIRDRA